jgi:EAL domain-containing protein (putative c-di-GMP-specific phosphodiesterase class I)
MLRDDELTVRDLGSTNGTYLNGVRVAGETPVHDGDLLQFADLPFRVAHEVARRDSRTIHEDVCDRALGLVQFDRLMVEKAVVPHFQPIVMLHDESIMAYEILGRSRLVGLETPAAMFRAAANLGLEVELSRMLRIEGIRASTLFPAPPHVFVNTHPAELSAAGLMESMRAMRLVSPTQRITLEIHEAAVTAREGMLDLRRCLEELDMGLAFDDFGAGQARLAELAEVRPDYLKFDRSMMHEIHLAEPAQRKLIASLVQMAKELGTVPLAEGIELCEEAEVCRELGFELCQGFYFGRPAPVDPATPLARSMALDGTA